MAEPGAPKRDDGGKLASRIEARGAASTRPPALSISGTRPPKAPLPPRASQVDPLEVAAASAAEPPSPIAALFDSIEPLDDTQNDADQQATHAVLPRPDPTARRVPSPSHHDLEADSLSKDFSKALAQLEQRRKAGASAPPAPSSSAPRPFDDALAQLQRQREGGAPAPAPPPSNRASLSNEIRRLSSDPPRAKMASIPSVKDLKKEVVRPNPSIPPAIPTEPFGTFGLGEASPLTSPLAPPGMSPGTKNLVTSPMGSLGLKPGSAPLSPNRTPNPMAIVGGGLKINADKPGSVPPKSGRPGGDDFFAPLPFPLAGKAPSIPPAGPAKAKTFPPAAGGPPQSYERAFRQFSSPGIEPEDLGIPAGDMTFQVYTPQDINAGRRPMRSMVAIEPPKKSNVALKIVAAVVGGIVVLLTAAAVIAVSTEEPKRHAPPAPPSASASVRAPILPTPVPSMIPIGDPPSEEPAPAATPTPSVTPTAKPPRKKPAAAPPGASPAGGTPIAPPPNPYGK